MAQTLGSLVGMLGDKGHIIAVIAAVFLGFGLVETVVVNVWGRWSASRASKLLGVFGTLFMCLMETAAVYMAVIS